MRLSTFTNGARYVSKEENACAPAHSFCMMPRKLTIWLQRVAEVACGSRGDLSGDTAEPFLYQLLQRPSGAVAGEHGKVVDVYVGISVSVCDLVVINLGEPVIRGNRAAV